MKKILALLCVVLVCTVLFFTFENQIREGVAALPDAISTVLLRATSGLLGGAKEPPPKKEPKANPAPDGQTTAGGETPAPGDGDSAAQHNENGYYFNQLGANAQAIYLAILQNCTRAGDISITLAEPLVYQDAGKDTPASLSDDMGAIAQPAMDALAYDHPEIDWIQISKEGEEDGSTFSTKYSQKKNAAGEYVTTVTQLTFRMKLKSGYTNDADIEAYRAELDTALDAIQPNGDDRYTQLLSLHNALCAKVVYDLSAPRAHAAGGALLDGRAVCDGYAKAFKLLCDRAGIPCVIVAGNAQQGGRDEPHAWNYVQMEDGAWYAVDVTWDDPADTSRPPAKDFFLVGADTPRAGASFAESHIPSGRFSAGDTQVFRFPTLAKKHYLHISTIKKAA